MTLLCRFAILAFALLLALPARAADDPIFGTWLTQDGEAWITTEPCGDRLCGRIVWVADPYGDDGALALDENNPDPALRKRTILGLPLLRGFRQHDDRVWHEGTIYNPDNGRDYSCNLRLAEPNRLNLHCYIGIPLFGSTQRWTRMTGPLPPEPPPPVKPGKSP